jgi:hypothetical protein
MAPNRKHGTYWSLVILLSLTERSPHLTNRHYRPSFVVNQSPLKYGGEPMSPFSKPHWSLLGYAAVCMLLLDASAALAETTLEKIKRTGVMTSANTFIYPPVRVHR